MKLFLSLALVITSTLADISLNIRNIVADSAVPQPASTVTFNSGSNAAAASVSGANPASTGSFAGSTTPQGAQIVAGKGTNGRGEACGCQCLCGAGSTVLPSNAGVGAFGGIVGLLPDQVGTAPSVAAMAPPPPAAAPSAGSPLA